MRFHSTRPTCALLAIVALSSLPLTSCASPTAITVDVYTEFDCAAGMEVTLTTAPDAVSLRKYEPVSKTARCQSFGHVGSVVLVPEGSDDKSIAFAVVSRQEKLPPGECLTAETMPEDCIVAKRQLRFSPNENLTLRVDLRATCRGIDCAPSQTCIRGKCESADVTESCMRGCDERSMAGLGPCARLANRVNVSTFDAPVPVIVSNSDQPILLAPRPSGGSLVGWTDEGGANVRVQALDAADTVQGAPLSFPGKEMLDLVAHDDGGAMLLVENDPDIYVDGYPCGMPHNCSKLDLLRFDNAGGPTWRRTLTSKIPANTNGAIFIWYPDHLGRLLFANGRYAAFNSVTGILEQEADNRDILRFFDSDGTPVGFGNGSTNCIGHDSATIAYNAYNDHLVSACVSDHNDIGLQVVVQDTPNMTVGTAEIHTDVPPKKDLVNVGGFVPRFGGVWLSHTAPEAAGASVKDVHLAYISNEGQTLETTVASKPGVNEEGSFLAEHGVGRMLLGYTVSSKLYLVELDKSTGEVVTEPVEAPVPLDTMRQFVTFPNGDVGYAASQTGSTKIQVVRVAACP